MLRGSLEIHHGTTTKKAFPRRLSLASCLRSSNIKVWKHNPFLFSDKPFSLNIWGLSSWYTGELNLFIQYLQTLVLAMNWLYHSLGKRQLLQEWSFLFTLKGTKGSREREIQKVCHSIKGEECKKVLPLSFPNTSSEKKSYLQSNKQKHCFYMQILVKQVVWCISKVDKKTAACYLLH